MRTPPILWGFFLLILVLGAGFEAVTGSAQELVPRRSFQIATGPSGGTYYPIGQAIARIVSHPPGATRCEGLGVCGPEGLIASARTSAGTIANVLDVEARRADAALAQSDVVAEAVAGKGPFRSAHAQTHIRSIATLFPEDVLVVASRSSGIRKLSDLKGKRVSLGAAGSGTSVAGRAVLSAARLINRVKASTEPADAAAANLERGKIDAFFFVGGSPVPFVQDLVARSRAVIVPIEGADRKALIAQRGLFAATIPAGAYAGLPAIPTVATHATLIVNDAVPADLVYAIARALFSPDNADVLRSAHESARKIRLETATLDLAAPLHPGAARFYAEARGANSRGIRLQ